VSTIGEGLAELGQGAITAGAIEPDAGGIAGGSNGGDGHSHESDCLNCGTRLVGAHCHACGQAAHVHRTLGAFAHDLLHGVFHFEGKTWRTLPLLIWQPGKLTREYIDGRRASYVSPIALFLFTVFLMFAVFHAFEGKKGSLGALSMSPTQLQIAIKGKQAQIDKLKAKRDALKGQGSDADADAGVDVDDIDDINARIEKAQQQLETLQDTRSALVENGVTDASGEAEQTYSDIPALDHAVKTFKGNPELAAYKLQTYAYKYSWALIPISVPFMWLMFPFSRRFHLYDHTVFVTYSLCFMSLLLIGAILLGAVEQTSLAGLLFFVPPFHMYRQLRGAYGCSKLGAWIRTVLLVGFASTALMLFFLLIMAQISV